MNYADAEMIIDKMNQKVNDEQMNEFLRNRDSLDASSDLVIEIFLECFLLKTHVSITHLNIYMNRYQMTLQNFVSPSKESSQIVALNCISKFWQKSIWHINLIIDKFVDSKLIKPISVINWFFKYIDQNEPLDHKFFLILNKIIQKVTGFTKISQNLVQKENNQNSSESLKYEKLLAQAQEQEKNFFQTIFKKFAQTLQENKIQDDLILEKILFVSRKYRSQIDLYYNQIQDEFQYVDNPKIKSLLDLIRAIKN